MEAEGKGPQGVAGSPRMEARAASSVEVALAETVRRLRAGIEVEESSRRADRLLRPRLERYFRSHAFPPEEIEDLVQKTLARVFQGVGGLRAEESFLPWLFTIARNVRRTAAAQSRAERRIMSGGLESMEGVADPGPDGRPETRRLEAELLGKVQAALAGLPAQQRQCLLLRLREELSYQEIAILLRLSVHTVRNHLAEGRRTLRTLLVARDSGEEFR